MKNNNIKVFKNCPFLLFLERYFRTLFQEHYFQNVIFGTLFFLKVILERYLSTFLFEHYFQDVIFRIFLGRYFLGFYFQNLILERYLQKIIFRTLFQHVILRTLFQNVIFRTLFLEHYFQNIIFRTEVNEKYTKTKEINSFQLLKFIQTHFYFKKIYVAVDLQQGTKLRTWYQLK